MKKSQLRNIIRESIKQLMTEQANPNAKMVQVYPAHQHSGTLFSNASLDNILVDGQTPQVGQYIEIPNFNTYQTYGGMTGNPWSFCSDVAGMGPTIENTPLLTDITTGNQQNIFRIKHIFPANTISSNSPLTTYSSVSYSGCTYNDIYSAVINNNTNDSCWIDCSGDGGGTNVYWDTEDGLLGRGIDDRDPTGGPVKRPKR